MKKISGAAWVSTKSSRWFDEYRSRKKESQTSWQGQTRQACAVQSTFDGQCVSECDFCDIIALAVADSKHGRGLDRVDHIGDDSVFFQSLLCR
jgi:hypothetical protein